MIEHEPPCMAHTSRANVRMSCGTLPRSLRRRVVHSPAPALQQDHVSVVYNKMLQIMTRPGVDTCSNKSSELAISISATRWTSCGSPRLHGRHGQWSTLSDT
jgi:hypothetical protein